MHEGGLPALYRGVVPALLGIVPQSAVNYYTYDTLKERYRKRTGRKNVSARLVNGDCFRRGRGRLRTVGRYRYSRDRLLRKALPFASLVQFSTLVSTSFQMVLAQCGLRITNDSPHRTTLSSSCLQVPAVYTLVFGATAGAVSQLATYPLEVARKQVRILARGSKHRRHSFVAYSHFGIVAVRLEAVKKPSFDPALCSSCAQHKTTRRSRRFIGQPPY